MIWTTWRQHRAEAGVAAALIVIIAAALVAVGQRARERAHGLGLPACLHAHGDCSSAFDALHRDFHSIPPVTGSLIALPLLAGMFWAAPLVSREYEAGTHRLAWSQSVGPRRWLLIKIALIFSLLAAAALAVGLLTTWALDPLNAAFGGRYNSTWYEIQGIVPVACMLFALSTGLLASVTIRRTIPAMAVTLVVYAAARIPMHWLRVGLVPTSTQSQTKPLAVLLSNLTAGLPDAFGQLAPAGALVRGTTFSVQPSGVSVPASRETIDLMKQFCPTLQVTRSGDGIHVGNADQCRTALHDVTLKATVHFQSASHFWAMQAVEVGLFVVLAAVFTGVAVVMVGRRRPA